MINVCLTVTDYKGVCPSSTHLYGELREHGVDDPERHGVCFEMNKTQARAFSEQGNVAGTSSEWMAGDHSYRFAKRRDLLNAALRCAREAFGEDVQVYLGDDYRLPLESMTRIESGPSKRDRDRSLRDWVDSGSAYQ